MRSRSEPRPDGSIPCSCGSTRRDLLKSGLFFGFGLAWPGRLVLGRLPLPFKPAREAKAQGVIQILLQGGLSHIDSFDPKPYAPVEVRGDFGTVPCGTTGECLAEPLARTSWIANQIVILRSMGHGENAHERAMHNVLTGYPPLPAITYPSLGSVTAHELSGRNNLPAYVAIPSAREEFLGTGYLGSAYGPFSIGAEPNSGSYAVRDLDPPKGVDLDRVRRRRELVAAVDRSFGGAWVSDETLANDAFYEQAYALIESPSAREAFNIRAEPNEVRDRYGRTALGQRLLLARRLAASGVRWVTVLDGSYDHHNEISRNLRNRLEVFDQGFAALISDLSERGLLESTIVLVTTEFGRTSVVNRDRGRDHWPRVFSMAAAGGGFKGGLVFGASNPNGTDPEEDPISPADLAATVFTLIGIDPTKKLMSPGDRPIDIVRDGRVIREILA